MVAAISVSLTFTHSPRCSPSTQYRNVNNPIAHYDSTAEEILQQCDGVYCHPRPSVSSLPLSLVAWEGTHHSTAPW